MSFFSKNQIEQLTSFAFLAGKIAVELQKSQDLIISKKPDNSRVTSADIAISNFFAKNLSQHFSHIPIVCEEGNLRNFSQDTFWLVDPIDGTSSYIEGSDQFAINLALIKNNKAVFGLIYAPLFEGGKMAILNENNQVIIIDKHNNIKDLNPVENNTKKLRIITSKKTHETQIANYVKQIHPNFIDNFNVEYQASATKFFAIIENKSDLFLCFRRLMEWDTAAGQALVENCSGKLKKLTLQNSLYVIGENLSYKKPDFTNDFFACYNKFYNNFFANYGQKISN